MERNTLQIALRTRVKLFFRPKDLKGQAKDAPSQLRWKLVEENSRKVLQAENPTPYYVSFENVSLSVDGKEVKSKDPQMVEPGGVQRFTFDEAPVLNTAKAEVQFTYIDDYGQIIPQTASLAP
jgi:P pilus assembly chaperone PapD